MKLWAALVAAIAALAAFLLWRPWLPSVAEQARLVAESGQATAWLPFAEHPPPRLRSADTIETSSQRARAARRLLDEAKKLPAEQSGSERSTAYLAIDEPQLALDELEPALATNPDDAKLWSAQSAAWLMLGDHRAGVDPVPYAHALEAASRALQLEPELAAARYNEVLALHRLHLTHEARRRWQSLRQEHPELAQSAATEIVDLDTEASLDHWRQLAEQLEGAGGEELATTARELAQQWPQASWELLMEEILSRWGAAQLAGDGEAAERILTTARPLAAALTTVTGDATAASALEQIDRAHARPDQLAQLARGHAAYGRGRALHRQGLSSEEAWKKIGADYGTAEGELSAAGSPLAPLAAVYLAVSLEWAGKRQQALRQVTEVQRALDAQRYPITAAYAAWTYAWLRGSDGYIGEASTAYAEAQRYFATSHQEAAVAVTHYLLGSVASSLGNPQEAWSHQHRALAGAALVRTPRWIESMTRLAARSAQRLELPQAALAYLDEGIAAAARQEDPAVWAEGHLARARGRLQAEQPEAALEDLDAGNDWARSITNPKTRALLGAQLAEAEAEVYTEHQPPLAEAALSRGLEELEGLRRLPAVELRAMRAGLRLRLGDVAGAKADLQKGLAGLEEVRADAATTGERIEYSDHLRELFDLSITLALDEEGDPATALGLAERGRGQELLAALGGDSPRPTLTAEQIRTAVVGEVTLVEYAVLPDRLVTWVVQGGTLTAQVQALGEEELASQVEELLGALGGDQPGARTQELAERLYDLLLRPIENELAEGSHLVFAPDKALHLVPFAALRDRRSGRFLIEDYTVAVTPSASVRFGHGTARPERPASSPTAVLAVGNPLSTVRDELRLADLKAAEDEVRAVARRFPGTQLLLGADATPSRVAADAREAQILHLAAHGYSNPTNPDSSFLVLADEPDRPASGLVTAASLATLDLPRAELVVLAACETQRASVSTSEGPLSLSRPFLAAGVPTVTATLWKVPDETTSEVFDHFYAALAAGQPPADALRVAQLKLLASSIQPLASARTWAPFVVLQGAGFP